MTTPRLACHRLTCHRWAVLGTGGTGVVPRCATPTMLVADMKEARDD
ncbi:hypothetical protein [Isoptericola sp. NPDC055881]